MSRGSGGEYDLATVVRERRPLADGVIGLQLAPVDDVKIEWAAGAHIDLILAANLIRQYSLCGDPNDQAELEIAVLRESTSRGGSAYVHDDIRAGDTVRVRGPRNNFPLVHADEYLFIAGGIGITPILPMVREVSARGQPWRLVYGGRTRTSMAFRDELESQYPDQVRLYPQDECGLLDLPGILDTSPAGTRVYCCGPEALIAAVEKECSSRAGLRLHIERFSPKARSPDAHRPDAAHQAQFCVELARSGKTVTVPTGVSIVAALADHGVEVPTSCREGTCGTCETTVLAGEPEHRDSLLTEEEQAVGDVMFVCVSRSRSDKLVLDL